MYTSRTPLFYRSYPTLVPAPYFFRLPCNSLYIATAPVYELGAVARRDRFQPKLLLSLCSPSMVFKRPFRHFLSGARLMELKNDHISVPLRCTIECNLWRSCDGALSVHVVAEVWSPLRVKGKGWFVVVVSIYARSKHVTTCSLFHWVSLRTTGVF